METLVQLGDFLFGFGVFLAAVAGMWWVSIYNNRNH